MLDFSGFGHRPRRYPIHIIIVYAGVKNQSLLIKIKNLRDYNGGIPGLRLALTSPTMLAKRVRRGDVKGMRLKNIQKNLTLGQPMNHLL
jgi:hypothetical protein